MVEDRIVYQLLPNALFKVTDYLSVVEKYPEIINFTTFDGLCSFYICTLTRLKSRRSVIFTRNSTAKIVFAICPRYPKTPETPK